MIPAFQTLLFFGKIIKCIFLDVDGILNSVKFFEEKSQAKRWKEFKDKLDKHIAWGVCNINPKAVKLLNKLVAETKAKIVVTSSWRGDIALQTIFSLAGIIEPIYGETPRLYSQYRGQEIQQWLNEHKCDKYVILDDDRDFFDSQLPYFVHIDRRVGLTESDMNKSISILNNEH